MSVLELEVILGIHLHDILILQVMDTSPRPLIWQIRARFWTYSIDYNLIQN